MLPISFRHTTDAFLHYQIVDSTNIVEKISRLFFSWKLEHVSIQDQTLHFVDPHPKIIKVQASQFHIRAGVDDMIHDHAFISWIKWHINSALAFVHAIKVAPSIFSKIVVLCRNLSTFQEKYPNEFLCLFIAATMSASVCALSICIAGFTEAFSQEALAVYILVGSIYASYIPFSHLNMLLLRSLANSCGYLLKALSFISSTTRTHYLTLGQLLAQETSQTKPIQTLIARRVQLNSQLNNKEKCSDIMPRDITYEITKRLSLKDLHSLSQISTNWYLTIQQIYNKFFVEDLIEDLPNQIKEALRNSLASCAIFTKNSFATQDPKQLRGPHCRWLSGIGVNITLQNFENTPILLGKDGHQRSFIALKYTGKVPIASLYSWLLQKLRLRETQRIFEHILIISQSNNSATNLTQWHVRNVGYSIHDAEHANVDFNDPTADPFSLSFVNYLNRLIQKAPCGELDQTGLETNIGSIELAST